MTDLLGPPWPYPRCPQERSLHVLLTAVKSCASNTQGRGALTGPRAGARLARVGSTANRPVRPRTIQPRAEANDERAHAGAVGRTGESPRFPRRGGRGDDRGWFSGDRQGAGTRGQGRLPPARDGTA